MSPHFQRYRPLLRIMLVVNKSSVTGEMIRVNDAPYSVLIRDSDIQQFDLQEGDVVDIAFYQNNPSTATIVWKYDVSSHTGLEKTKEFCKLYNVPFDMISGRGKSKVIQTAMDLINEQVSVSS